MMNYHSILTTEFLLQQKEGEVKFISLLLVVKFTDNLDK